jgi:hypothetical protein
MTYKQDYVLDKSSTLPYDSLMESNRQRFLGFADAVIVLRISRFIDAKSFLVGTFFSNLSLLSRSIGDSL